jgi:hypothetical protein
VGKEPGLAECLPYLSVDVIIEVGLA